MDATVFADAWFEVGGRNAKQTVTKMELRQEVCCHELAILRLRHPDTDTSTIFRAGSPVLLRWGRKPSQQQNFHGYCGDVEGRYDRRRPTSLQQVFDVPVIGASMPLKRPFTYTWENVTAEQIARQIADAVMFNTDITGSDMIIRRFSSPGLTGWQVLCKLAYLTGNLLATHNTTLTFVDPLTLIKRRHGRSPTFHTQRIALPETILEFAPKGGQMVVSDGARKVNRYVYGVDASTASAIRAESRAAAEPDALAPDRFDPMFSDLESCMVADSPEWAQTQLDGAVRRNRFSIRAFARLSGDSRVTPGTGVMLRGIGDKHSGLWLVEKVIHHLEVGSYYMDCDLIRDATGSTGAVIASGRRVIRPRLDPFNQQVYIELGSILTNGGWRAQWGAKKAVSGAG